MPNYKGHLLGASIFYGVAIVLLSLYLASTSNLVLWFFCTLAGGLFPDIDIKSKGQRIFYALGAACIISFIFLRAYLAASMVSIAFFLPLIDKHRGIFHNIWFLIALCVVTCSFLMNQFPVYRHKLAYCFAFFALGIISHLILDLGIRRAFGWR